MAFNITAEQSCIMFDKCIEACEQQNFINTFQNIKVVGIALVTLLVAIVIFTYYDEILAYLRRQNPLFNEGYLQLVFRFLLNLTFFLLAGFLVWFIWFR